MLHPDDRALASERLRQALAGERDYETEYRIRRADGQWRWLQSRGRVLRDEYGRVTRMLGVALDITARKQAEEQLRQSDERYRAFLEQSSEAIWRFEIDVPMPVTLSADEQLDYFYQHAYLAECNDATARQYGYERGEDLVGARLPQMVPRADPANIAYLRAFIASGYRLTEAESHEFDRTGAPRYFLNNLIGIIEGEGANAQLVRAWGTQRDITERKHVETALRESERKLWLALDAASLGIWEWHRDGSRSFSANYANVVGAAPPDSRRVSGNGSPG